MKKPFYLLLCICFIGCEPPKRKVFKKPFIIVDKYPRSNWCGNGYCEFTYQGSSGNQKDFCEKEDAYMIGDTIK